VDSSISLFFGSSRSLGSFGGSENKLSLFGGGMSSSQDAFGESNCRAALRLWQANLIRRLRPMIRSKSSKAI
ncbi:unnamed protein product, partial [Acidithrix sp. C25]